MAPAVSPEAFLHRLVPPVVYMPSSHHTDVSEPQVPENNCTTGSKLAEADKLMFTEVELATKLYHTSSLAVPTQAACDWLAQVTSPTEQDPPTVSAVAPLQLSFAGPLGVVTWMEVELELDAPQETTQR